MGLFVLEENIGGISVNIIKNKKGFTLVELIIVIVIIGILSLVSVPVYRKYIAEACMTEGYTLVGAVARAELIYATTKGSGTFLKGFDSCGGEWGTGDGIDACLKANEISIWPDNNRFFYKYRVKAVTNFDRNKCTDAIQIYAYGYADEDRCDEAWVYTTVYSDGHIADFQEGCNGY